MKVPDIPEFTIPAILSVDANTTAITHPGDLTQGDWLIIARNSRILYAYTMGTVSGDDEPPQATKAALDWMVPETRDYLVPLELGATVVSEVTYTAETASYVRAGVDKQQASVGFPFAAASFEREHKERQAGASYQKQLQCIGRWYFPRVKLIMQYCAATSERFETAIRNALESYDRTSNLTPLLDVFKDYGTAVPNEVILGGQMFMVHREDYQGSVREEEVENVISAAVSIKTGKGEGSAGVSFQNATGSKVTADQMSKMTKFTVRGGDTTKASAPTSWPDTVKPPSSWTVIGRSGMISILDWLPADLRARVMAVWPKLPVPPAIWELRDTVAQDHVGKAERAQFVLGARNVPDQRDGARGVVQLVCGTSMTPELGRGDAAGGAASFHRYRGGNTWIDTSSVCLPVPTGHHYAATAPDTWAVNGKAPVRFAIAETNLTLDKWRLVETAQGMNNYRGFTAPTDGFVFCSVEASNDGDRGYVTCEVDKVLIAAASVHNYAYHDDWIRNASFCVPFTKGSAVEVKATPTSGRLSFSVWQIPSTSQAWRFTKPQPLKLGAWVKADTDGFVNGVVTVPDNGPRGILRLDCVKDRESMHSYPIASAAVHVWHPEDRHISHASAMVPARKDYMIFTELRSTSGAPQAQAYWTGVVPIM